MDFRTIVDIPKGPFELSPCERMFFVGSCFADSMGRRAQQEKFRVVVNPYGVMYNPASVLHTVQQYLTDHPIPHTTVLTLGTNHVYILKETGEIVDNCQKRPQHLFEERELTVDECADYLRQTVSCLLAANPDMRIVLTVSPIRYRKYGYHESQLSKATLLLAIQQLLSQPSPLAAHLCYFPSYEIVLDELRDYRFYAADMLHPSEQAVEYIWQRFGETFFSEETKRFMAKWQPLKEALAHRPFNPDSEEYQTFRMKTLQRLQELQREYPDMVVEEIQAIEKQ